MESIIKDEISSYLTADSEESSFLLKKILEYPHSIVVKLLELPDDSIKRFRIYDLAVAIKDVDTQHILKHIFDDCSNNSDPLTQLSAFEFCKEHNIRSTDLFIELLNKHINDPILSVTLAETTVCMITSEPDVTKYIDSIKFVILKASEDHNLLVSVTHIAKDKRLSKLIVEDKNFMELLDSDPYEPALKAILLYIRTLLVSSLDEPEPIIMKKELLSKYLGSPEVGLRVATLEHIAITAPIMFDSYKRDSSFINKLTDVSSDTTLDEFNSRLKAQRVLGIAIKDKLGKETLRVDEGPQLEVL